MNPPYESGRQGRRNPSIPYIEALGQSEAFLSFSDRISMVAPVNRPVLLIGERGTGKELAASRLHYLSTRWQAPFVTLNCAALTPSLIEAELFGYERGAFTGADKQRSGRFEAAHNGTLFLDEIGNLPLEVQAKILRVVEYGVFERVGGTQSVEVDVRIIGATNADLGAMAADGRFKSDLLDRLAFEVLVVPPLRDRLGDIDMLADHFAAKMAVELNREQAPRFSRAARRQLNTYHWPGNIRELKNVVERAVYRSLDGKIETIEIDPFTTFTSTEATSTGEAAISKNTIPSKSMIEGEASTLDEAVSAVEIRMVKHALHKTRFNQRKAADMLGLTYDRLRGLIRKHADHLDDDTH
jgi:psp operon transcriptional activator